MTLFNQRLIYVLTSLFVILILAIWSSSILTEWGVDYGVYYAGSYFLDENYRIYKEFFTHKGPLYYLFIKTIGNFIGWGQWQAYFSLLLTMLVFYIPIIFILISERVAPLKFISGVLISICLLYNQNTNSCISFFQYGFLIISFWLLIKKKTISTFIIAFFFLICAILTRIDAIIYLPVYIIVLIFSDYINNYKEYLKIFFISILIATSSFYIIMNLFEFNLNQYLVHNLEFNNWYKNKYTDNKSSIYILAKYLIRPQSFSIFTGSLFIIPFIILLTQFTSSLKELFYFSKNFLKEFKSYNPITTNGYITIIVILGLIGWFLTISDTNFHLMMVLVPLLFFYLMNIYCFNIKQNLIVILFSSYCVLSILIIPVYKIYKDTECLISVYCKSSVMSKYSDTILALEDINNESINIIGGEGWIYFFSNLKPNHAINDVWFYNFNNSFLTKELINQHNNLLNMPQGKIFLIANSYLNKTHNKYLIEILKKSVLIESQSNFSIFQIK